MSNRALVWCSIAVAVLIALAGIWFLVSFDRVPYETRTAPKREALRNPYLAAEKLLQQLGYRVETVQEAAYLDRLGSGGTLLLSAERQFHLTPARREALFRWVESGGYLVADADRVSASDPVLRRVDVRLQPLPAKPVTKPESEGDEVDAEAEERAEKSAGNVFREPPRRTVAIPGYGRALRMRANSRRQLYPGSIPPAWLVHAEAAKGKPDSVGAEVMHFRLGRGNITLINGLSRFSNYSIDKDDHAELLAALCAVYQPRGEVRIMTRLDVPSLWEWLAANAQAALASAGVLLLLWLWRVIPRFGVIRPEPPKERRSLIEHLRAIGLFLWRRRSLEVLLEAARSNFQARLTLRHAALAGLPTVQLCADLARQTALTPSDISYALVGKPQQPEDFTAAIKTLRDLEQKLQ